MTLAEVSSHEPPTGSGLLILMPVFDDWKSLGLLLRDLDDQLHSRQLTADVLIVDDGSTSSWHDEVESPVRCAIDEISVLRLRRNLGHQRAIAVGLSYVEAEFAHETIVIMDSDGEDSPTDVPRLLEKYQSEGREKIVFAGRVKRSEALLFRVFYRLYRGLHYLLTGQSVQMGNFSVVPRSRLRSLVAVSELWNHYAAAVVKSRQPYCVLPTSRSKRHSGKSQMNFVSLVIHGLSAISVNADIVGVRMLIVSCVTIFLALAAVLAVVGIRLFTTLGIPGWATYSVGLLFMIVIQFVMLSIVFSFITLSGRQGTTVLPLRDYKYFVLTIQHMPLHTEPDGSGEQLPLSAPQSSDEPQGG